MKRFLTRYHLIVPKQCLAAAILAGLLLFPAAWAQTSNQVPNPEFRGNQGAVAGNVTGEVPSAWRGFAVGSSSIELATQALSADELFSGSPASNAVRLDDDRFRCRRQ